ncbi:MAG: cell division protein ZapE [Pseudomonadota bacterium]
MSQNKSPKQLYQHRLNDGVLKPDTVQARAIEHLERLFAELQNYKPRKAWFSRKDKRPKGVYFHSGVGRGKSMLMDLFYECVPEKMPKMRVHFHAFMIDLHDYHHQRRNSAEFCEGMDSIIPLFAERIAERAHVLCFDEFHVTDVADAMILGRLFRHLFDRGVVVIATSNWEPDRLYEGGLQRDRFLPFIELLKDKLEIVHLDSPIDYRTQFLAKEGTYFTPLGSETTRHANTVFNALTDNMLPHEDELVVKGRKIPVSITAKGVARFTFAQLCEQPHGAEDYLAITEAYHTVFLENVPKLTYDRRNEAKRLITLIDTLYEAKTKLVVTADAPPSELYRGDDHGFEFDRTISRLMEMQSEDYLEG